MEFWAKTKTREARGFEVGVGGEVKDGKGEIFITLNLKDNFLLYPLVHCF